MVFRLVLQNCPNSVNAVFPSVTLQDWQPVIYKTGQWTVEYKIYGHSDRTSFALLPSAMDTRNVLSPESSYWCPGDNCEPGVVMFVRRLTGITISSGRTVLTNFFVLNVLLLVDFMRFFLQNQLEDSKNLCRFLFRASKFVTL